MDDKNLHNDLSRIDGFPEPEIPANEAWSAMQQLMLQSGASPTPKNVKTKFTFKSVFFGAAGIILLGLIADYVIKGNRKNNNMATTVVNTTINTQLDTLPGNIFCFADTHTSLQQYPNKTYQLTEGGIYFLATPEDNIIRLQQGALQVEAHRGGFFIQHDSTTGITSLHLQNGTAIVRLPDKAPLELHTNESIAYDERKNQLGEKQKSNANLFSYATLIFEFNDTPLKDAAAMLEKAYGVKIEFSNENLKKCRITTRLDNKTLTDALGIIGYTLNFEYSIKEQFKTVIISGPGCD